MKIGNRKKRNVHETAEPLWKMWKIGSLRLEKISKTTRSDRGKENIKLRAKKAPGENRGGYFSQPFRSEALNISK